MVSGMVTTGLDGMFGGMSSDGGLEGGGRLGLRLDTWVGVR